MLGERDAGKSNNKKNSSSRSSKGFGGQPRDHLALSGLVRGTTPIYPPRVVDQTLLLKWEGEGKRKGRGRNGRELCQETSNFTVSMGFCFKE